MSTMRHVGQPAGKLSALGVAACRVLGTIAREHILVCGEHSEVVCGPRGESGTPGDGKDNVGSFTDALLDQPPILYARHSKRRVQYARFPGWWPPSQLEIILGP